jgi:toxin ParE1/3/4
LSVARVIRTKRADDDLVEIWAHIAQDNPLAADRTLDAIEAHWSHLALHPLLGRARDDIASGIRHLVTGQYLTLYRFANEDVEILRVLHGRRKIDHDILA